MAKPIELKWKRPDSLDYPTVWHTFKAKDIKGDSLVGYRIEDLTESKYDEALAMMVEVFVRDEPLSEAYGVPNDPVAIADILMMWRALLMQNAALVCFRDGSDEIVGVNMNYVAVKDDHFMENCRKQFKSFNSASIIDVICLLNEGFDPCEHYNVDKYLGSVGLVVAPNYRGRGVGEHFLQTRRNFCKEFGITLTSTAFTSKFSNQIADNVGYKADKILSYNEIRDKHPELKIPPINSDLLTLKSLQF